MSEQFEFCKITKVDANLLNVKDENATSNLSEYICQHPLQTAGVAAGVIVGAHVFIPLVENCIPKATAMAERLLGFPLRNVEAEAANVLRTEANAASTAEKIGTAADSTATTAADLPKVEILPKPTEPIAEAANNASKVGETAETAAAKPATTSVEDAAKTEKAAGSEETTSRTRRSAEKAEKPASEKPRKTDGQRLAEQVSFLEAPPAKWTRIGSNRGMVDWLRQDLSVAAKDAGAKTADAAETAVTKAGKALENSGTKVAKVADDATEKALAATDTTVAKAIPAADNATAESLSAEASKTPEASKAAEALDPAQIAQSGMDSSALAKAAAENSGADAAANTAKLETATAPEEATIASRSRTRRVAASVEDDIIASGKTDGEKLVAQLDFLKPPPAAWTRIGSNRGMVDFLRKDLRT